MPERSDFDGRASRWLSVVDGIIGCSMFKTFRYRAYLTAEQEAKANRWLELCRQVYNAGLQERKEAWRVTRKTLKFASQSAQLPTLKAECHEYAEVYAQVLQNVLRRLDGRYRKFYTAKKAKKPGRKANPPKFRGNDQYLSLTWPQKSGFSPLERNRLKLSGFGVIHVVFHRPLEGKPKTCTLKRGRDGRWHVTIVCELPDLVPARSDCGEIAIDLGVENYAAAFNGSACEFVDNPRHLQAHAGRLAVHQRVWHACKPDSKRRDKAVSLAAKVYSSTTRKRDDFQWKLANKLARENRFIYAEALSPGRMIETAQWRSLRRNMGDAAWGSFLIKLAYKAIVAGSELILVDPAHTSARCSGCGVVRKKELGERQHTCPCGLSIHRDENAARNIFRLGRSLRLGEKPRVGVGPAVMLADGHNRE